MSGLLFLWGNSAVPDWQCGSPESPELAPAFNRCASELV